MIDRSYVYDPAFVDDVASAEIMTWLGTLVPLWEMRYSTKRPPPAGKQQRPLLRPVYWLGNWQFACLGYYEPPKRTHDVAVAAEPFPPVLARLVAAVERRVRAGFPPNTVPRRWHLNTCLVNFYGDRDDRGKSIDVARVGEHRDFEPGPVASLSIGERAVEPPRARDRVERQRRRRAPPARAVTRLGAAWTRSTELDQGARARIAQRQRGNGARGALRSEQPAGHGPLFRPGPAAVAC